MRRLVILVGIAVVVATSPVAADWLVMRDGAHVETQGPWKVKGKTVVFTLPNGTLSSVRLDEVDLDASAVVTVQAEKSAEQPAEEEAKPPAKEPVLVLTNKDVKAAAPAAPAPAAPPSAAAAGETAADGVGDAGGTPAPGNPARPEGAPAAEAVAVEVVAWNEVESPEGDRVEIIGTLRNTGATLVRNLSVEVSLEDGDGNLLVRTHAFLRATRLIPGGTTTFRALFQGAISYAGAPRFDITGSGALARSTADREGEAAAQER